MNTQNQIRKIDLLQLSDPEKTKVIKEIKEILRQRIKEAKASAETHRKL
ncbi:MAG TPA: hypothetical protein VK209_00285 [Candidatus Sulfotelmatobacter sp.]|nr:hypothetical protein [Candidatus Sulfotelmatobacter sp.]